MPEETQSKPTTPAKVPGRDVPFPANAFPDGLPDGVDAETRLFHGFEQETKERLGVTLEGLKAEFGDELGEKKYIEIAGIGSGSVFFNPKLEASNYRPPLGIFDLEEKYKAKVAEILAAKE